jgi:Animal haem peroxidase
MSSHGSPPLRGLMSTARSQTFDGRFGRMFRSLPVASYGNTDADTTANLTKLGKAMESAPDDPKDGPDAEESGIPALYTYFGQFIDHDLTFGPEGSFQKQRDPDALVDFRTPAFDLDCVYGRGPGDQPYLYNDDGQSFLLGSPIGGGGDAHAADLPRNGASPARALIGDPRNDENVIVSQLQGLFLRFHNRLLVDNQGMSFETAQKQLQRHYQYVILHDFLPRFIDDSVLAELKTNGHFDEHKLRFYRPKKSPFMPLEFSTAAYRFGHSMIRPGYRLNDNDATLLAIFAETEQKDLRGKHAMDPARGIDWGRFIDTDTRAYGVPDVASADNKKRLQFAYRIDTSLVNPLSKLPPNVATGVISLAARNLLRSFSLGLPTGQAVARAMHITPLDDEQILIGKAVDDPANDEKPIPILSVSPAFKRHCPLWTYILAEAMQHKADVKVAATGAPASVKTPRLGPVGGRIVAETFLGLMFGDSASLLRADPAWTPAGPKGYALKDFVLYATGKPST